MRGPPDGRVARGPLFEAGLGGPPARPHRQGLAAARSRGRRPRERPAAREIELLLEDAFRANPLRYGSVASLSGLTARTTTGVEVTLDWDGMSLRQQGRDTDRIDLLYRIHYLQWTGIASVDRILGGTGLALVLTLTLLGARLAFRRG